MVLECAFEEGWFELREYIMDSLFLPPSKTGSYILGIYHGQFFLLPSKIGSNISGI